LWSDIIRWMPTYISFQNKVDNFTLSILVNCYRSHWQKVWWKAEEKNNHCCYIGVGNKGSFKLRTDVTNCFENVKIFSPTFPKIIRPLMLLKAVLFNKAFSLFTLHVI
jgi:hypothetical protein